MYAYRLYFLDAADHIRRAVELDCESDEEALAEARAQAAGAVVDLWLGERHVARLEPSPET